jgi:transposase IS66-like protein
LNTGRKYEIGIEHGAAGDVPGWLADVLARLPDHPAKRIAELLPWKWRPQNLAAKAA